MFVIKSELIAFEIITPELITLRLQWTQLTQQNQVVSKAVCSWEGRAGALEMLALRLHALDSAGKILPTFD